MQKPKRNRTEQVNNPIQNYFLKDTLQSKGEISRIPGGPIGPEGPGTPGEPSFPGGPTKESENHKVQTLI